MYIVTETQTAANGAVSVLPPIVKENDLEARSVFFQICAAICISDIPIHTVTLETNEGFQIDKYTVRHGANQEEEEESNDEEE